MINYLHVENFKSLHKIEIAPTNLNLLLGLNSMGKSSLIQTFLLLRQSFYHSELLKALSNSDNTKQNSNLKINGDLVSLGNSKDIFYQNAALKDNVIFEVKDDFNFSLFSKYNYEEGKESFENEELKIYREDKTPSLFSDNFFYLSAEHIGPSKTYSSIGKDTAAINILGNRGEFAPYYLALNGNSELKDIGRAHPKAKSNNLSHQVDAWLSEISPGAKLIATALPELDLVKLNFRFQTDNDYTDMVAPVNVGFGLSYVLPLILILLIAQKGDLVLIENPESHLHPKGQAELGKLISLAAENGVQIFCETHSDHVINGIRVSTKNSLIQNDKVSLFFFDKDENENLDTRISTIKIDKNGELSNYPRGLLDQWGDMMSQLF